MLPTRSCSPLPCPRHSGPPKCPSPYLPPHSPLLSTLPTSRHLAPSLRPLLPALLPALLPSPPLLPAWPPVLSQLFFPSPRRRFRHRHSFLGLRFSLPVIPLVLFSSRSSSPPPPLYLSPPPLISSPPPLPLSNPLTSLPLLALSRPISALSAPPAPSTLAVPPMRPPGASTYTIFGINTKTTSLSGRFRSPPSTFVFCYASDANTSALGTRVSSSTSLPTNDAYSSVQFSLPLHPFSAPLRL